MRRSMHWKSNTWKVPNLPKWKNTMGCKWVFPIKYKCDGTIKRYKAHLVVKGYTQSHGIDYQETLAPVTKIDSIQVLLSLATNNDWSLQQLDIKNVILHGNLEKVFMNAPPSFKKYFGIGKVCKLKKYLYGLKQ